MLYNKYSMIHRIQCEWITIVWTEYNAYNAMYWLQGIALSAYDTMYGIQLIEFIANKYNTLCIIQCI